MKQNSSILFHFMVRTSKNRIFAAVLAIFVAACCPSAPIQAAEQPEYLASFDPSKGFKPVQRDLTEIYLQIAGSLEATGSPEGYLRYIVGEHARIEKLYKAKFGRQPTTFRPAYLTDAYIDTFSENWKYLSSDLGLDAFAKEVGHMMREAIKGTRGSGTMLVEILNAHQTRVFDRMNGKTETPANFETLRRELETKLELDQKSVNEGRYEVSKRDAIRCAIIIHGMTMKLFARLDAGLKPEDAAKVKAFITSAFIDVGRMAESELQAGISEWALETRPTSN